MTNKGLKSDEILAAYQEVKEYVDISVENFYDLIKSEKDKRKIEDILELYNITKYESGLVPSCITTIQMKDLMLLSDPLEIEQEFVAKLANEATQYEARQAAKATSKGPCPKGTIRIGINFDPETKAPIYGVWRNSMFFRINKAYASRCYVPALISSSLFGQKLVIDCGYTNIMTLAEKRRTAFQIARGFACIRQIPEPFDVVFCNYNDDQFGEYLDRFLGTDHDIDFKWQSMKAKESYTELFPRNKLVYLSPHAPFSLQSFDPEEIYIVGGLELKDPMKCLSHNRAKENKIKCLKLPLDKYFPIKHRRTLTTQQTMCLLSNLKSGLSMKESISLAIPKYKIRTEEEIQGLQEDRLRRLSKQKKTNSPQTSAH